MPKASLSWKALVPITAVATWPLMHRIGIAGQGEQHRLHREQCAGLVGDHGREVGGFAALQLAAGGEAAQPLDDVVVGRPAGVGPALAEALDPHHDEAGTALAQAFQREPERPDLLGPHAADKHIRAG